jgi:hypothetical protein
MPPADGDHLCRLDPKAGQQHGDVAMPLRLPQGVDCHRLGAAGRAYAIVRLRSRDSEQKTVGRKCGHDGQKVRSVPERVCPGDRRDQVAGNLQSLIAWHRLMALALRFEKAILDVQKKDISRGRR